MRYRKPVGIYWLQAVAVKAGAALGVPDAHTTIWLYRIPSLLGAIGAVLATYWCALVFVSRRGAVLAALMLASFDAARRRSAAGEDRCGAAFHHQRPPWTVLARAYLAKRPSGTAPLLSLGLAAVFWSAIAGGILIKGPLILMVAGLAAVTLSIVDRSGRWLLALRPLAGLGLDVLDRFAVVRRDLCARRQLPSSSIPSAAT